MNKFKHFTIMALCAAGLILQGCATGSSTFSPAFHQANIERVAVVGVSGDIRGQAPKNQVEDFFAQQMLMKGYRIIERSRVASILEEQDFQFSEATTSDDAARIGRILNVSAVIMLDVSVAGEKVSVSGRMVDPETAEVLWIGTGRGGTGRTLATVAGAAAGAAGGYQLGGSQATRTAAGIGGGLLGGAAGHALAPQTARIVERAIERMVEDLPRR